MHLRHYSPNQSKKPQEYSKHDYTNYILADNPIVFLVSKFQRLVHLNTIFEYQENLQKNDKHDSIVPHIYSTQLLIPCHQLPLELILVNQMYYKKSFEQNYTNSLHPLPQ